MISYQYMIRQKQPIFRNISYGRRLCHITKGQRQALTAFWPKYGIVLGEAIINLDELFGRIAPLVLEVGFGSGEALISMAQQAPDVNFLGVEVYQPGIGKLLSRIAISNTTNIRVFCANVVDVLDKAIANNCLNTVCIFFPDPWPKRRHHKRRLINQSFINLLVPKLKVNGQIHLATDWEDYAQQMARILNSHHQLCNSGYLSHTSTRPTTKFEQRGLRLNHRIYDLRFTKQ